MGKGFNKTVTKTSKAKHPDIPWGEDDSRLVLVFLTDSVAEVRFSPVLTLNFENRKPELMRTSRTGSFQFGLLPEPVRTKNCYKKLKYIKIIF